MYVIFKLTRLNENINYKNFNEIQKLLEKDAYLAIYYDINFMRNSFFYRISTNFLIVFN